MFSYFITTYFILNNKDNHSCCNSYSVYQTCPNTLKAYMTCPTIP